MSNKSKNEKQNSSYRNDTSQKNGVTKLERTIVTKISDGSAVTCIKTASNQATHQALVI